MHSGTLKKGFSKIDFGRDVSLSEIRVGGMSLLLSLRNRFHNGFVPFVIRVLFRAGTRNLETRMLDSNIRRYV
jgi:hypothetical protein